MFSFCNSFIFHTLGSMNNPRWGLKCMYLVNEYIRMCFALNIVVMILKSTLIVYLKQLIIYV